MCCVSKSKRQIKEELIENLPEKQLDKIDLDQSKTEIKEELLEKLSDKQLDKLAAKLSENMEDSSEEENTQKDKETRDEQARQVICRSGAERKEQRIKQEFNCTNY